MRITEGQLRKIIREVIEPVDRDVEGLVNSFMRDTFKILGEPDDQEAAQLRATRDRLVKAISERIDRASKDRPDSITRAESEAYARRFAAERVAEARSDLVRSVAGQQIESLERILEAANDWRLQLWQRAGQSRDERFWERLDGTLWCIKKISEAIEREKAKFAGGEPDFSKLDSRFDKELGMVRRRTTSWDD